MWTAEDEKDTENNDLDGRVVEDAEVVGNGGEAAGMVERRDMGRIWRVADSGGPFCQLAKLGRTTRRVGL